MKLILQTIAIFCLITSQAFGQASIIDTTFGLNGKVKTSITSADGIVALAEQTDGKILACGDSVLMRYEANGKIDSTFGVNGIIENIGFYATDIAIQTDGKILVGGQTETIIAGFATSLSSSQRLKRLHPNGTTDNTYGVNGIAQIAANHPSSLTDIAIHPNGNIITSGIKSELYNYGCEILQYSSNGMLDTAFSFLPSYKKITHCQNIHITADSSILISGAMMSLFNGYSGYYGWHGFRAIKLLLDGSIDSTYGVNGMADIVTNFLGNDIPSALDGQDELHLAGTYLAGNWTLYTNHMKIDSTGQVDSTYDYQDINSNWNLYYEVVDLVVNDEGMTYVSYYENNNFNLDKLDEFAQPDSICFHETQVDFDSLNDIPACMIQLANGKIILAGKSGDRFAMVRFDPSLYKRGLISETTCDSYTFNNKEYTSTGEYMDTITSVHGCDSIIELDLTIYPTQSSELETEACTEFTFNGYSYTNSGNYIDTLQSIHGCDSIVELDLTINNADAQIMQEWDSLVSMTTGTAYQWINCQTGTPISGATQATFDPDSNGTYAMILTDNGCSDTSDCIDVFNVGVDEREASNFVIYPNPSNGSFTIQFDQISQSSSLEIYTISGQLIFQTGVQNQQTVPLNLDLSQGMYILQSTVGNRSQRQNLVIH